MAYKFNPLIKECLQLDNGGGGGGDTQQKVTKCTTADELSAVEEGEIFEWQGADTSDPAELVNGYFYKKHFLPASQQVLILYHPYAYIGDQYLADTYYYSHSFNPNKDQYSATRNTDNKKVIWIGSSSSIDVGAIVTISNGETDQIFVTIVDRQIVDLKFVYTDSNGESWSLNNDVNFRAITYNYYTNNQGITINVNWNDFFDNMGFICVNDGKEYIVRWTQYGTTGAKFDTVINPEGSATYTQTNTQPPTPGITEENGTLKVSFPVEFADDVTVKGTQTVVHTEEIESENDYIELRADNPLGLANGERSGLEVNNYDGNGTDCILAVDNQGWARVGDKGGTLQKLATIEETPTAGAFMKYNATDKELESTTDGSGLSVTFTPDTTPSRAIIQPGDTLAAIAQKIAKKVVITPTFINTPSNPDRLKITLNYNIVLISAYDLVFPNGLNDGDKICNLPFIPSIQWNYSIYLNNSSAAVNPIYVVSVDGVTSLAIKGTVNAGQGISFTLTVF